MQPDLFLFAAPGTMAAAVVGLRVPGVVIENIATTGKTLPEFERRWSALVSASAEAH